MTTTTHEALEQSLEALQLCLIQLYHDGVMIEPCHPKRIAATAAENCAVKIAEILGAANANPVSIPDLTPFITWLENGCDPKEAAKELRIYRNMEKSAANAAQDGEQNKEGGIMLTTHAATLIANLPPSSDPMEAVTLESAREAIEHVEQHNGPGRAAEARRMLVRLPVPMEAQPRNGQGIIDWYTPEEIKAKIASHDYCAELMLMHAMHWLDAQPTEWNAAIDAAKTICEGLATLYPREDIGFDKGYSMSAARAAKEISDLKRAQPVSGAPDERRAFEAHFGFDYTRDKDAWGLGKYARPFVQAIWEGWQVRAALSGNQVDAQPTDAAEAKLVPEDKICEMWGVWYDGSRGGISGWVGGNGIPDLFQSKEKAQMICPTEAYQPRLILMYAALPVPVDAQPTKTDCND